MSSLREEDLDEIRALSLRLDRAIRNETEKPEPLYLTEIEQEVIDKCGDICKAMGKLRPLYGPEMDDMNFHLRAIQNIIYARPTMRTPAEKDPQQEFDEQFQDC